MAPNTVLVTGVSRFLGGHFAARLAKDPNIERIIGVDSVPPSPGLLRAMGRAEFVLADIRNPLIVKVVADAGVDTVVHAATNATPAGPVGRAALKEMNVIGTMQLLAACQHSETVRKLVIKSASAVYGASSQDPALFTENMTAKVLPSNGYARDAVEVEEYVRAFSRRRPDIAVTTLRFTNVIGPNIDTVLARYFALPVVPTVFGYDPRMQLLHTEDALAVLERAVLRDLPGVFNVGATGVIMLSQAIRRAGRIPLPLPEALVPTFGRLLRSSRTVDFSPDQLRFLNFGRCVDTTLLTTRFGYQPRWSTDEAFDDYVRGQKLRPVIDPARLAGAEARILDFATKLNERRGVNGHA